MLPALVVSIPWIAVTSIVDGEPELIRFALVGGAIYFGFLFIAHLISPRGMGFGDVKLAAVMGLFVGWLGTTYVEALALVLWAMLIGFASGSVFGFAVLLRSASADRPFPFGPFLALGTVVGGPAQPAACVTRLTPRRPSVRRLRARRVAPVDWPGAALPDRR